MPVVGQTRLDTTIHTNALSTKPSAPSADTTHGLGYLRQMNHHEWDVDPGEACGLCVKRGMPCFTTKRTKPVLTGWIKARRDYLTSNKIPSSSRPSHTSCLCCALANTADQCFYPWMLASISPDDPYLVNFPESPIEGANSTVGMSAPDSTSAGNKQVLLHLFFEQQARFYEVQARLLNDMAKKFNRANDPEMEPPV
jgi:hypothetical protein